METGSGSQEPEKTTTPELLRDKCVPGMEPGLFLQNLQGHSPPGPHAFCDSSWFCFLPMMSMAASYREGAIKILSSHDQSGIKEAVFNPVLAEMLTDDHRFSRFPTVVQCRPPIISAPRTQNGRPLNIISKSEGMMRIKRLRHVSV